MPNSSYLFSAGTEIIVSKGDNAIVDAFKLILLNYSNLNITKIVVNKIERVK